MVTTFVGAAMAQPQHPKVVMQNGHVSPLMVKVTYVSGTTRTVMLLGIGMMWGGDVFSHSIKTKDEAESEVNVWLDTIKEIRNPNDESSVFFLKSGTERKLWYSSGGCACNVESRFKALVVANDDGGQERIDLPRIKQVEFLDAARRDKAKNAMFDQWTYSPFTGEKLPDK